MIAGVGPVLKLWDTSTGRVTSFSGHSGDVTAVAVSDTGSILVSGGVDRTVRIWPTGSKRNRADSGWTTAISTNGAVSDVKASGSFDYVVSGERDGYVRIYEASSGKTMSNTRCWLQTDTKYTPASSIRVALQNENITSSGKARRTHHSHRRARNRMACARISILTHRDWICGLAVRLHA